MRRAKDEPSERDDERHERRLQCNAKDAQNREASSHKMHCHPEAKRRTYQSFHTGKIQRSFASLRM